MAVGPEIVALDATARKRPGGGSLDMLICADPHPLPFAAADGGYCHRAGGQSGRAGAGVLIASEPPFTVIRRRLRAIRFRKMTAFFWKEVLSAVTIPVIAEGNDGYA